MSICLGVDMSTQSCSGILLNSEDRQTIWKHSIPYRELAADFALNPRTFSLDGLPPGAFEQPPLMFVECLDRLFYALKESGFISRIEAISVSAQQHSHVYMNASFERSPIFSVSDSAKADRPPVALLRDCFSYPHSPIWMTANTKRPADEIRAALGGSARAEQIAGADVPLRFTGVIIRRIGQEQPDAYRRTACIHLISSFLTALLAASPRHPIDFGNASGMLLMDYRRREWSDTLLDAVAAGLPGGKNALRDKLPPLASAYLAPQCLSEYWIRRHGFSPNCLVASGGGDNPHTKSLIKGDLLSLGTSFVYMQETDNFRDSDSDGHRYSGEDASASVPARVRANAGPGARSARDQGPSGSEGGSRSRSAKDASESSPESSAKTGAGEGGSERGASESLTEASAKIGAGEGGSERGASESSSEASVKTGAVAGAIETTADGPPHFAATGANGMYDGLDRPFYFFPRTNGALVWDKLRGNLTYAEAEKILAEAPFGKQFLIWQPLKESFPVSPIIDPIGQTGDVRKDYPAIIDTTLAILAIWSGSAGGETATNSDSAGSQPPTEKILYVTGGASASRAVLERISALWKRPVCSISEVGTPMGAALSAYASLCNKEEAEKLATELIGNQQPVRASKEQTEQMKVFITEVVRRYSPFVQKKV